MGNLDILVAILIIALAWIVFKSLLAVLIVLAIVVLAVILVRNLRGGTTRL